jgi:putative hydrolase of the HAD superfamily
MSDARDLELPPALVIDIDNTVYAYAPCHDAGLAWAFLCASERSLLPRDADLFRRDYENARRIVKARLRGTAASHSRLLYFKQMVENRAGRSDFELTEAMESAYWEGYRSALIPDEGCREVLERAVAEGVRIAWASNFTTARQMWKLKNLGLDRVPAILVTSEEAGADKPDPSVIRLATDRLRVSLEDAVVIGDEAADLDAARALGLPVALRQRDDSAGLTPGEDARIFRSWMDLPALLAELRVAEVYV